MNSINNNSNNMDDSNFLDFYFDETLNKISEHSKEATKSSDIDTNKNSHNNIEDVIPFNTTTPLDTSKKLSNPIIDKAKSLKSIEAQNLNTNLIIAEINNIESSMHNLKNLILDKNTNNNLNTKNPWRENNKSQNTYANDCEKIVIGMFDGEKMIGNDGKQYSVPANYASKSKLVDGDTLKLTIKANGVFIYKQINPIERVIVQGLLAKRNEGGYVLVNGNKEWRLIKASITYYNGIPGEKITALIPKHKDSNWAALDNIIRN